MRPTIGREILSWVFGILIFGFLNFFHEAVTSHFGLSTSFSFLGEYGETDNATPLGWLLIVIDFIIASRIGMAIYHGNFKDGVGKHTNLLLVTIVGCLGFYAVIDTVVWEFFERGLKRNIDPFFYNVLNLGLIISIVYAGIRCYRHIKDKRERGG